MYNDILVMVCLYLKDFCLEMEPEVTALEGDYEAAKEVFLQVVKYFGENPKLAQPNSVFPTLQRFRTSFSKAHSENLEKERVKEAVSYLVQAHIVQYTLNHPNTLVF